MSVDLTSLLLTPPQADDATLWAWVEAEYRRRFLTTTPQQGRFQAHDGAEVVFYADRVGHAFKASRNYIRHPTLKTELALDRIERMAWILPVIQGQVEDSACWHVPSQDHREYPPNRLYLVWGLGYCVWLEPLGTSGRWRFSSAYPALPHKLRSYCLKKKPHCGLQWHWPKGKTPSRLARGLEEGAP